MRSNGVTVCLIAWLLCPVFCADAEVVVKWDFTTGTHGWSGNARVEPVRSTAEGLLVVATGEDPWIEGPAVDYPADKLIRIMVEMKSSADLRRASSSTARRSRPRMRRDSRSTTMAAFIRTRSTQIGRSGRGREFGWTRAIMPAGLSSGR